MEEASGSVNCPTAQTSTRPSQPPDTEASSTRCMLYVDQGHEIHVLNRPRHDYGHESAARGIEAVAWESRAATSTSPGYRCRVRGGRRGDCRDRILLDVCTFLRFNT